MVLHFRLEALAPKKKEVRRYALCAIRDSMEDSIYSGAHNKMLCVAWVYNGGWSDGYKHNDDNYNAYMVALPLSGCGDIYRTCVAVGDLRVVPCFDDRLYVKKVARLRLCWTSLTFPNVRAGG